MKTIPLCLGALLASSMILGCACGTLMTKEKEMIRAWQALAESCRQRAGVAADYAASCVNDDPHVYPFAREVERTAGRAATLGRQQRTPASSHVLKEFQSVQDDLTAALARLMVTEDGADRTSITIGHSDLHRRLDEIEMRVNKSRVDFQVATHDFNLARRAFPHVIVSAFLNYHERQPFRSSETVQVATGAEQEDTGELMLP